MTGRPTKTQVIDAVNTSTHVHASDFEKIQTAIREVARENRRVVDPNLVREALTNEHGLTVDPRTVGGTYSALITQGVLIRHGWTTSTDKNGRNVGKPARRYRVIDRQWLGEVQHEPDPLLADQGTLFDPTDAQGQPS